MKQTCALCLLFVLAFTPHLRAASAEDNYLSIYNRIQEADRLAQSGRPDEARQRFIEARTALETLQREYPAWNPNVVQFRLNFIASKLAILPKSSSTPETGAKPLPDTKPGTDEPDEATRLRERVRQLESEKDLLTAKLKEALAALPAAIDPEELSRAQERIRAQEREIELLRVNLDKAQAAQPASADKLESTQQALAHARQQLADQAEHVNALTLERDALQNRLMASVAELEQLKRQPAPKSDPAASSTVAARTEITSAEIETLKGQLQTLHRQLAEEKSRNDALAAERALMESRLRESHSRADDRADGIMGAANAPGARAADHVTVSALQTALTVALQEKARLENDLRQQRLSLLPNSSTGTLPALTPSPATDVENQISELQSRLAILEARRTPYSPEELALFRVPAISLNETNRNAQTANQTTRPAASVTLVAEADKALRAGRFQDAESKLEEALEIDRENADVLARLAGAQMEQDRWQAAERSIERALAQDPRNATALYLLGRVRYRQGRLDEALGALSQAAHINSRDPVTFDFLGMTLSRMGLRDPAETALRRAVQLAPGYGGAHHNLAVVYAAHEPPAIELARWHYQRALAAGHPRNAELEARLDGAPDR
jgi:tetratricopeptide (TPR) repeat protein